MDANVPLSCLKADLKFFRNMFSSNSNGTAGTCSMTSCGMGSRNLSLDVSESCFRVSSLLGAISAPSNFWRADDNSPICTKFNALMARPNRPLGVLSFCDRQHVHRIECLLESTASTLPCKFIKSFGQLGFRNEPTSGWPVQQHSGEQQKEFSSPLQLNGVPCRFRHFLQCHLHRVSEWANQMSGHTFHHTGSLNEQRPQIHLLQRSPHHSRSWRWPGKCFALVIGSPCNGIKDSTSDPPSTTSSSLPLTGTVLLLSVSDSPTTSA